MENLNKLQNAPEQNENPKENFDIQHRMVKQGILELA